MRRCEDMILGDAWSKWLRDKVCPCCYPAKGFWCDKFSADHSPLVVLWVKLMDY